MKEQVLLVGVEIKQKADWPVEDILKELEELVLACGAEPVHSIICRIDRPTAGLLIGEGKVQEIAEYCQMRKVDTVVFSHDLKGSQQRNLEQKIDVKTIDRTQLILDIFARRATSSEGKMQVELAQLEYLLPRLVGHGNEMSRLGGGIGTLGPGETKLETDRRRISDRISKLKKNLKDVSWDRETKRKKRREHKIPAVSLVGYTNAGKSTLLNRLTNAGQRTHDGLFTTLDSLSRQFVLPSRQKIVVSDTVGFMHELPHHLIEAFKATLEEVQQADLLLHVVDVSHPNFRNYLDSVQKVLAELQAADKPAILVLNKIDKLESPKLAQDLLETFPDSVAISALNGEGLKALIKQIEWMLGDRLQVELNVPLDRMDVVNLLHQEGKVLAITYSPTEIKIKALISESLAKKLGHFWKD